MTQSCAVALMCLQSLWFVPSFGLFRIRVIISWGFSQRGYVSHCYLLHIALSLGSWITTRFDRMSKKSHKRRYGTQLPLRQSGETQRDQLFQEERVPKRKHQPINGVAYFRQVQLHDQESFALSFASPTGNSVHTTSHLPGSRSAIEQNDAWLPYRRNEQSVLRDLAAEIDKFGSYQSSSGSRSTNEVVTPFTQISEHSYTANDIFIEDPPPMPPVNQAEWHIRYSEEQDRRKSTSSLRKPSRKHQNHCTVSHDTPPSSPARSTFQQDRILSYDRSEQTQPALPKSKTNGLRSHKRRQRLNPASSRDLRDEFQDIDSTRQDPVQFQHRQQPSVSYESVDGILLSTKPKKSRTDLTIPEIEAQEIQKIRYPENPAPEYYSLIPEFEERHQHYAEPPPPIGAYRDGVRAISPRSVIPARTHVFVDRYSRTDARNSSHLDSFRPATSQSYHPPITPPRPRLETPSFHTNDSAATEEESAAESPMVNRHRTLKQQDEEMTSRTSHVRSLLSGMLGTFSSRLKKSKSRTNSRCSESDTCNSVRSRGSLMDVNIPAQHSIRIADFHATNPEDDSGPEGLIWQPPRSTQRFSAGSCSVEGAA